MRAAATALCLALAAPAAAADSPFQPGEQIDLRVDFLRIPTGRVRIAVGRPEGAVWPVMMQARTDGIASVADIRQHLVALWDPAAGQTRGYDLSAVEMRYRHQDRARYDREKGKAQVVIQGRSLTDRTIDIPADVHDLASVFLWLRLQALRDGDHHELPLFSSDRVFTLVADVLGRETVEVPAGRFPAVQVRIRTAFEGQFKTNSDSVLWFSDDARRVLVQASADFVLGSLVARLERYQPGGEVARR
ncbi:MAG: DUF3108 domain-containing protein [Deltaproteobacteria bacterium]|nr:DUF3108 domain-containing protein [Deltaproteobacteria bacterium]